MLPYLCFTNSKLPRILCIDEFKGNANKFKYIVTDLWETNKDIGMTYFRKAKIVANHFYFVRYVCNAVNEIRIEVQKNLPDKERKYFKHSRKLLLTRRENIKTEEQINELESILINYSANLRIAYREKECLLGIIHSNDYSEIRKQQFYEWITRNLESPILQLRECTKTYQYWSIEIKNSLEVPYSNGPIEGFNNKIKTLKRVTFGMHNFKARIMLLNRS